MEKLVKLQKKLAFILAFAFIFIFVSCQNQFYNKVIKEELSLEKTPETVATEYFKKLESLDSMQTSRTISSVVPSFIENMEIETANGKAMLVSELPQDEQEMLYKIWLEQSISELTKKLSSDEDLLTLVNIENTAFYMTIDNSRSANNSNFSAEKFLKKYQKNLSSITNVYETSRSASQNKEITKDCLVKNSVDILKANYKKGYILICTDTTSSSASSFIGHSSIMAFDTWQSVWEEDGLARMTITAYPKNMNAKWECKTNGVQLEPIGLWAGNSGSSANKVKLFSVQKEKWVWNWFNSGFQYTPAPDSDYNSATEYALAQIGKPYNWSFIKDLDSAFCCSSLIYKSWKRISNDYDMSLPVLFWVAPSDIANSNKTVLVTSFNNK